MSNEKKLIEIENTRFIFATNFSGDASRDKYKSSTRKGNLIIPDADFAQQLADMGFNIKMTRPRDDDDPDTFEPEYFVSIIVNYGPNRRLWPKVYLVGSDRHPVLLDEDTVGEIDDLWISNVNVVLSPHEYDEGRYTLYVRTMYVELNDEDDPYASRYSHNDD